MGQHGVGQTEDDVGWQIPCADESQVRELPPRYLAALAYRFNRRFDQRALVRATFRQHGALQARQGNRVRPDVEASYLISLVSICIEPAPSFVDALGLVYGDDDDSAAREYPSFIW